MPSGYGVVRRDHERNETVCAPVPFNVPMRLAHIAWWWLKLPWVPSSIERYKGRLAEVEAENKLLRLRLAEAELLRLRFAEALERLGQAWVPYTPAAPESERRP